MLLASLLVLLGVGGSASSLKPASKYFQICHTKDPNIDDCIKKSIEALRPQLIKGIPELNLVPLDPLYIPRMEMKEGNGRFRFHQTLSNLNIYGLRNFEIKNITVNLDKNAMTFVLFTKQIDFYGDYDMAGRMMVIDLKGNGKATLNFTDVTTTAFVKGEVIRKKGVEYYRVKSFKWKIEPGEARSLFTNLFNGDKTLGNLFLELKAPNVRRLNIGSIVLANGMERMAGEDGIEWESVQLEQLGSRTVGSVPADIEVAVNFGDATNRFLNENWREAFGAYRRLPEEAFGTLMMDLANRVYSLFPKEELYPE